MSNMAIPRARVNTVGPIPNLPELTLRIIAGSPDNVLRTMRLPGTIIPTSNVLYDKYQAGLETGEVTSSSVFVYDIDWEHIPDPILSNMFEGAEKLLIAYEKVNGLPIQGYRGANGIQQYRAAWFDRPIASHHSLALWGGNPGSKYLPYINDAPEPLPTINRPDHKPFPHGWECLAVPVLFQIAFILDMPHLMNMIKKLAFGKNRALFAGMFRYNEFPLAYLIDCEVCGLKPANGTCVTCLRGRYCSDDCRVAGHTVCSKSALCINPRLMQGEIPLMNRYGFLHGFGKDALTELYSGVSVLNWSSEEHLDMDLVGLLALHCQRAHGTKDSPAAEFFAPAVTSLTQTGQFFRTLALVGKKTSFALDVLAATKIHEVTRLSIKLNPTVALDIVKFKHLVALNALHKLFIWRNSILQREDFYRATIEENWIEGFKVLLSANEPLDLALNDFALVRLARRLGHSEILELMRLHSPAVAEFLKRVSAFVQLHVPADVDYW